MTNKVVFYARAASKSGEGSIVAQVERGRLFAAERGWSLAASFSDVENNEALFKARPGMKSLCAYLECEQIDIVLCDAPLNVSDNRTHVARFLKELGSMGIELWSAAMAGRVTLRNLPYAASGDQGKDATSPSLESCQGIRPAGFGYKLSSAIDVTGRRIFGYRVIHPEEAEAVRRIFRMYAAGRSPRDIASALNADGIKGPGGKPWRDEAIYGNRARGTGILNNILYVGMRQNAAKEFDGYVPALRIVSDELWHRVRQQQANVRRRFSQSR
ncbi:recombinase family protein [Rhizobium ruizarguesonis]|jgi:DNA invertase Pin-like site-specific DNA recombinase|uniref:recombinase family protein n=1 Tax=Rhizobium ruizarguesonis TaxID=2081791 RepID=UPI0010311874|nr:recombinase family protein [Rhizobium ruizarguesonis]TBE99660.1 recombinase family protein [Rhizobium ruizarguesonis]